MDLSNFVIDRILRGSMFHSSEKYMLWSVNQIKNPSLNMSADTVDAVDALDAPIMTFNRAKSGEFSAENALFDLGLLAAQSGTTKQVSSADVNFPVPCYDEFTVSAGTTTFTLSYTPKEGTFKYIYRLDKTGNLSDVKYAYGDTASATAFTYDGTTLTVPTGLDAGTKLVAIYDYIADDTNQAIQVVNTAKDFPTSGEFVMQILGCDTCDISTKYFAYLIFPKSQLLADFDLSFATDMTHGFTIKLMQDYCSENNELFRLIVPDAVPAAA